MPETYRVRGKGSEYYQKQFLHTSRGVPESKEYRIFGYEVDAATYKKFNRQDYRVAFGFHGLMIVERWATDPDIAKKYPERAVEAKAIMDEIITQITGKEQKNMKEPRTAADFIKALQDIYTESRAAYDAIQGKVKAAQARMDTAYDEMRDPACKNRQLAEAKYDFAKGEYKMLDLARYGEYRKMNEDHESKVKELREKFAAYLDAHYAASPDKLDTATMQLLNSGICTAAELARLAERHADNPTMLRIVGSYAERKREDKQISHEDRVLCSVVQQTAAAAKDGSREMAIFDSAVSAAAYGLGKDYDHATNMHKHIPGWLDGFTDQIQNLPVTPAEISGAAGDGAGNGGGEE